ncbi:hypothetical protein OQA88_146 [Cercophora sp. LCS_1]
MASAITPAVPNRRTLPPNWLFERYCTEYHWYSNSILGREYLAEVEGEDDVFWGGSPTRFIDAILNSPTNMDGEQAKAKSGLSFKQNSTTSTPAEPSKMSSAHVEKVACCDDKPCGEVKPKAEAPAACHDVDCEAQIESDNPTVAERIKQGVKVHEVTIKLGMVLTILAFVYAMVLPALFGSIIAVSVNLATAAGAMQDIDHYETAPRVTETAKGIVRRGNAIDVTGFSIPSTLPTPSAASADSMTSSTFVHESTITVTVFNGSLEPNSATNTAICTPKVTVTVTVAMTVDPLQTTSENGTPMAASSTSTETSSTSSSSTGTASTTISTGSSSSSSSTVSSSTTTSLSTVTAVATITATTATSTKVIPVVGVSTYNATSTFPHTTTFSRPTGSAYSASGSLVPVSSYNATWTAPANPHVTITSEGSSTKATKKTRGGGTAVSYCVMMAVIFATLL